MVTSLILGASGMIGQHYTHFLKQKGHRVIGVDRYPHTYPNDLTQPDEFYITDLTVYENMESMLTSDVDEVYHFAAEMGGAGYVFTGAHDAEILTNSLSITLNLLRCAEAAGIKNIFYTSSACIYPEYNQLDEQDNTTEESSAFPAQPDSEYGWEKLIAERIMLAYAKDKDFRIRIARLHNVFGPFCCWNNGREKSPAALCRKVAEVDSGGTIDVWGPGTQTRSFLHIDQAIEGIYRIMYNDDYTGPFNLGSEEMISINDLALLIADIADKDIVINNRPGPLGVVGRTSDNNFIHKSIGWKPEENLREGLTELYKWINSQVIAENTDERPV